MRGQKLVLVKGVYSLEKWTKPNPLMSTENRPVDISSVAYSWGKSFLLPEFHQSRLQWITNFMAGNHFIW